ncbi:hypothetical protein niasHT_037202 [Heterodera trifolii]|uniref:G-protein coupled receptors family 1 profile domain-containing protein n=1 Tax=Heterodera trifolii TaxID=157864 RepID=A0ABD2ICZ7_9BILA
MPIILTYAFFSLFFVYSIAWTKRNEPVEAYCGRRKVFTKYYSIYTFMVDIFSYSIALAINCATALRLARLRSHLKSRGHIQRQLNRVHYMLVISLFSTLTVTVPNVLFLSNILLHKWMHFDLTDPSNWLITAKCAANFFVFLLFKEEFRVRIYEILGCISRDPSNERQYEVSALGIAMTSRRRKMSVAVVEQQRNDQQQKMKDDGFFMLADMLVNKSSKSNNELTVEMGRGGRGEEQTTRRSANF